MPRKALASILILVFFSLQYGKIASYWYCKWQAEQQQLANCDCESHLNEMFADSDLHNAPVNLSKGLHTEYTIVSSIIVELPELLVQTSFKLYTTDPILTPLVEEDLRPPIA